MTDRLGDGPISEDEFEATLRRILVEALETDLDVEGAYCISAHLSTDLEVVITEVER